MIENALPETTAQGSKSNKTGGPIGVYIIALLDPHRWVLDLGARQSMPIFQNLLVTPTLETESGAPGIC